MRFKPSILIWAIWALIYGSLAWAVTTSQVSLSQNSYTDLGAGPLELTITGGGGYYQISDTQPSPSINGYFLPALSAKDIQTSSHVWAIALTAQTTKATIAPISSISSSPPAASKYDYTPLSPGQHNLAITSSSGLTVPATATFATVCAKTAISNYTTDGTTTPTSSVGQPLAAGACVGLSGATVLANFRAISASGTLDVEYFR